MHPVHHKIIDAYRGENWRHIDVGAPNFTYLSDRERQTISLLNYACFFRDTYLARTFPEIPVSTWRAEDLLYSIRPLYGMPGFLPRAMNSSRYYNMPPFTPPPPLKPILAVLFHLFLLRISNLAPGLDEEFFNAAYTQFNFTDELRDRILALLRGGIQFDFQVKMDEIIILMGYRYFFPSSEEEARIMSAFSQIDIDIPGPRRDANSLVIVTATGERIDPYAGNYRLEENRGIARGVIEAREAEQARNARVAAIMERRGMFQPSRRGEAEEGALRAAMAQARAETERNTAEAVRRMRETPEDRIIRELGLDKKKLSESDKKHIALRLAFQQDRNLDNAYNLEIFEREQAIKAKNERDGTDWKFIEFARGDKEDGSWECPICLNDEKDPNDKRYFTCRVIGNKEEEQFPHRICTVCFPPLTRDFTRSKHECPLCRGDTMVARCERCQSIIG